MVQLVENGSFETGWAPWLITQGDPYRTSSCGADGTYGLGFGGANNEVEHVYQQISGTVPEWAESGAVYFAWQMVSEDSTTFPYDSFNLQLWSRYEGYDSNVITSAVYNNATRATWYERRVEIPDVPGLRGHTLQVMLSVITNSLYRTWWCIDDVRLVFACGSQVP